MGKVVECITPELKAFIEAQPLFFVASAPLAGDGHVNLSPKGLDCFRVLSPRVQTSCGFAVPFMEYGGQRETLLKWAAAKGDALPAYQREKNTRSIDGLPAPIADYVTRTPSPNLCHPE
jgi:hypothetical protein